MSILRRLLLSITLAIAVILIGTLVLSINAAREYLAGQLQTQSEDAAVSLALTLSQPGNDEPAMQTLLVSALFDGGHFALVRLADPEGKVIVERRSENLVAPVPAWFRAMVPLTAKQATHVVSDGWRQIGAVTLIANDIYAWETLWGSSLRMILMVLGAGAVWAIFAYALVSWIKGKLLAEIAGYVRAMGKGELSDDPIVSRVAELSVVTEALQQARENLRITAEEQNAKVESLEIALNQDPVTGAANRKFFINEFRRVLETSAADGSADTAGHVIVFRQRDLAEINRHMHRALADEWLQTVYKRLKDIVDARQHPGMVLARLNGSDFALLYPNSDAPAALQVGEQMRAELRNQRIPVGEGGLCRWAIALGGYALGEQAGEVLGRLDNALMQAESAGDDRLFLASDASQQAQSKGEEAWRRMIMGGIENQRFDLDVVPLYGLDGKVLRHEASLTLRDAADGAPMAANLFIPPAMRLHLVDDCDLEAARLGLAWLSRNQGDLVLRFSLPSLKEPEFHERLETMLAEAPELTRRLFIEIDAHGLVESYDMVARLCHQAFRLGARIGLRRLAQQLGALTRLADVPVAYVKLGGNFVIQLSESAGSQALMRSVIDLARGAGIDVCAEDVPDEATAQILKGLGVALMRGPGIASSG